MAKTTTRKPYEYTTPEAPVLQEYIDPKLFPGFGADDAGKVLGVNEKGEWCCHEGRSTPGGGGVTSWNDLTDKPFYDESPILYEGYPEYAWGYAKLPFVLRGGVSYEVGVVYPDIGTSKTFFWGEPEEDDGFYTLGIDSEDDEERAFRLEHNEGDGYSYFYPDGSIFSEGGMLRVKYSNAEDAGTIPLAERFMPRLTSPNGTKFKITVADDGTLSAVAE